MAKKKNKIIQDIDMINNELLDEAQDNKTLEIDDLDELPNLEQMNSTVKKSKAKKIKETFVEPPVLQSKDATRSKSSLVWAFEKTFGNNIGMVPKNFIKNYIK